MAGIKMKKKLLTTTVGTLLITGCASNPRTPASFSTSIFSDVVGSVQMNYQSLKSDPIRCEKEMVALYQRLFELVGNSVYLDMDNITLLDQDIEKSFETRLALKESFRGREIKTSEDRACFQASADVFKALRYVEDYMIEMRMEKTENAPTEYVNMKGDFPYLLVNPLYKDDIKSYEDLKSGDVILSRGGAYSSAAIARIGESDFQFSHLSFVYRNPETNSLNTTEAHIEIGAVTAPFEEHLNEKNARSVVFRYNDSEVAKNASEFIYNRVKTQQSTGKNIQYDFSMNYKDDSKLFCSEIISTGFHHELPNEDYFPMFKSHFQKGLVPFLNNIGVPVTNDNITTLDVFSPADIQFDPRFDLVMEWRNPKKMEESRFKDFILTKLFQKMEKENYIIDPSLKMDLQSKTFWLLRRFPIVRKFVEKKFPLNMTATQMEMFMSLDKIGEAMYKEIEKKSVEADHRLTPKEVYEILDTYFEKDLALFNKKKSGDMSATPELHQYFHPRG
jgi:hypothetical protein